MPVPDSVTTCGEPAALSVTVRVPLAAPVARGKKIIAKVQEFPIPKENGAAPQFPAPVLVNAPATVTLVTFRTAEPGFDRVTVCAALPSF